MDLCLQKNAVTARDRSVDAATERDWQEIAGLTECMSLAIEIPKAMWHVRLETGFGRNNVQYTLSSSLKVPALATIELICAFPLLAICWHVPKHFRECLSVEAHSYQAL